MKRPIAWTSIPALFFLIILFSIAALLMADLFILPFLQGKFAFKVLMPDLRGMDSVTATKTIANQGFTAGEVSKSFNDSIPAGRVISQVPLPKEEVKRKRRVHYTLSLGREMVRVPDLRELSPTEASDTLQRIGLRFGETHEVVNDSMTPGAIVATYPGSGKKVPRGSAVDITISQNSQSDQTYVPDFDNIPLEQAQSKAARAFLRVRQVTYQKTAEVLPNTVLSQSIRAGMRVGRDTFIDFVVSE